MNPPTQDEVVHIAGDGKTKSVTTHNLQKSALAQIELSYKGQWANYPYKEKRVTCEVYKEGGQLMVHTLCVRCNKPLRISAERKRIDYDKSKGLFIEPFGCTWELQGDQDVQKGPTDAYVVGANLCGARVAYDGRVVKDA